MVKMVYIEHSGKEHVVDVARNRSVMEGARDNNIPGIEADCGGSCTCATCHAYIHPDWIQKLPVKSDVERDMLDFAHEAHPDRSRLTCQLKVQDTFDGLVLYLPERQA